MRRGPLPPHPATPPTRMFRGNHPATVDPKGRLKVPAAFLPRLLDSGKRLFVTSVDRRSVALFPMSVWEDIEAQLNARGNLDPARQRFLLRASYYGHEAELDAQGRLLLPQQLRSEVNATGKVDVLGKGRYLEAWNHDTLLEQLDSNPLTDEDLSQLDI